MVQKLPKIFDNCNFHFFHSTLINIHIAQGRDGQERKKPGSCGEYPIASFDCSKHRKNCKCCPVLLFFCQVTLIVMFWCSQLSEMSRISQLLKDCDLKVFSKYICLCRYLFLLVRSCLPFDGVLLETWCHVRAVLHTCNVFLFFFYCPTKFIFLKQICFSIVLPSPKLAHFPKLPTLFG